MAVTTAIVASVAISATSAGMSFGQARQQKKLGEEAKRDAQKAMAEAKAALEVNFYDKLAVQKEPYELERDALLAQGALATQAGVEGDRGAAATAGKVQAAMNEAQAGIRTGMGKEMSDLEKLSAEEDARLRDIGVQLNLEEVAGAQQAMADSAVARSQAIQSGMQSVGSAVQGATQLAPLYGQNMAAQKSATYNAMATPELEGLNSKMYNGQQVGQIDFNKMSNPEFRQFKNFLGPEGKQQLFQSQPYLNNYNPNPFEIR
jgi:hypothetical protein